MDVALFKYHATKNGDTMRNIAAVLGKASQTLVNNLYGHRGDFTRADIAKLKSHWKLTNDQVAEIFFNESEEA